jgi:hypothetical protein
MEVVAADAKRCAHVIMEQADRFVHDGQLTITEMMAYLQHTEHEGFLEWLLENHYHDHDSNGHFVYHGLCVLIDHRVPYNPMQSVLITLIMHFWC